MNTLNSISCIKNLKGKFQSPFFECKIPGREIFRFSQNGRKNRLLSYILGGKSGFTMLHKFTNCASLSLKIHMSQINFNPNHELTVHINLLPPSKEYLICYEPLQLLNVHHSMSITSGNLELPQLQCIWL